MESIAPNWKMKKYQSQYRFDLQVSGIMRIMLRLIQVSEPTAVVCFLLDCSALWVLYICLANDLSFHSSAVFDHHSKYLQRSFSFYSLSCWKLCNLNIS